MQYRVHGEISDHVSQWVYDCVTSQNGVPTLPFKAGLKKKELILVDIVH